jgi:hypothetical protein
MCFRGPRSLRVLKSVVNLFVRGTPLTIAPEGFPGREGGAPGGRGREGPLRGVEGPELRSGTGRDGPSE